MKNNTRQVFPAPRSAWPEIRARLQSLVQEWPYAAYYDSCGATTDQYGDKEVLAAGGRGDVLILDWDSALSAETGWWFGLLPYELGHRFHPQVPQPEAAPIEWPEIALFRPDWVSWIDREKEIWVLETSGEPLPHSAPTAPFSPQQNPRFQSNFSTEAYLQAVADLQEQIRQGNVYEINLSQIFSTHFDLENSFFTYQSLISLSPVPFSAWFRFGKKVLISASPERFLQRKGNRLLTQPIKGTIRRGSSDAEDEALKLQLRNSEKEQAENVMIVDLSRHDLNRVCLPGTVRVLDLFEVQTFPQVHQLVTTVMGEVAPETRWRDLISGIFPPGSMTGAPKQRAMQLIGGFEGQGRGAYSGALGYFSPEGDFDFNVVIRSLIADGATGKLVYQVGGAITIDSDPQAEYEETLLKAKALRAVFEQNKKGA